jgi:threonine dehydratase
MDLDLNLARIEEAARTVDPVFLNTPQYADAQLSTALGRDVVVKVETANPLRSFKGRGADFFMAHVDPRSTVVCSSTGNFGQALAYAARRRGIAVEVFVPENVNPVKLARMRAFGASVTLAGADSAASEAAARDHIAGRTSCVYVEDGKEAAIAEGAGTIGIELIAAGPFDAVVVPVGDGALITGIARWIKDRAPKTRIIGVCASGAPSMALSWRTRKPVSTERSDTIAEGIEVRVPVPESVVRLVALVDDLEEKGLCERARHPDDRRRHVIQLTAKGRKMYRDARALSVKVGDEIFAPLERSERAQLTAMLKRIMEPLWLKPR